MFESFSIIVQHNMQIALCRACKTISQEDKRSRAKAAETIIRAAPSRNRRQRDYHYAKRSRFKIVGETGDKASSQRRWEASSRNVP
jgi:hypothetical protein